MRIALLILAALAVGCSPPPPPPSPELAQPPEEAMSRSPEIPELPPHTTLNVCIAHDVALLRAYGLVKGHKELLQSYVRGLTGK